MDNRYRDGYGRIEWISSMTLAEIVLEINERLSLLEQEGHTITEVDADPRVIELFGTNYQINQFLYTQSTRLRKEHASIVLISIPHSVKTVLDFERPFNQLTKSFSSYADAFLQTIRNMCDNLDLLTPNERQHVQVNQLDQMYDNYSVKG